MQDFFAKKTKILAEEAGTEVTADKVKSTAETARAARNG
jgi:hypothetical protein